MKLKKALFTLAFMNIMIAAILSLLSFWGCLRLSRTMTFWDVEIYIGADTVVQTEHSASAASAVTIGTMLSVLQIVLPMSFFVIALLATASLFYRWKLKDSLAILTDGANRIMENDLDFTLEATSTDELGKLCTVFETMRQSLLKNNRELWRQTEERKRLNAAFSHDLRNTLTVLQGSVKLARQ
ncbi:MAG: HAMP domain-containing protein [Acetatifactor sp.]|nr:HAMP domain-containing protein [Acetatifactor sp.]